MLPQPSPSVRLVSAAIFAAVLLSALVTAILAITVPPKPAWTFVGFEVVIAVCCAVGLPFGRGAYREGPGLALTCFAGAIFAGSVLGYLSVQGVLGATSLKLWVLARVSLAALLGAAAAVTVLSRNPRSWGLLTRGLVLLAAPAAVMGIMGARYTDVPALEAMAEKIGRVAGPLTSPAQGIGEVIRLGAVMVLGVLLCGLCCAGLHFVIRAFEAGREENPAASAPRPA